MKDYIDSNEPRHILDRGNIVDKAMRGRFGEILTALINGLKDAEFTYNQTEFNIPADRRLGRCEGYTNILNSLYDMIDEKDRLEAPIVEEGE